VPADKTEKRLKTPWLARSRTPRALSGAADLFGLNPTAAAPVPPTTDPERFPLRGGAVSHGARTKIIGRRPAKRYRPKASLTMAPRREEDVTVVSESNTRGGGSMHVYQTPVVMIREHNDVRIVRGVVGDAMDLSKRAIIIIFTLPLIYACFLRPGESFVLNIHEMYIMIQ
jgi:hypothetical protein